MNRLLNSSAGAQRTLALGLLVLFVGLVVWAVFWILAGLAQQRDTLNETRERAGRLLRFATMDLSASSGAARAGPDDDGLFLAAPSMVIARANLQQRVNTIASDHNTQVSSSGNLPDLKEDATTLIGLRLDFEGAYQDVTRTVLAIEAGLPPLVVKELSIRSTGGELPDRPPELAAQLHIYAAVRTGAAAENQAGQSQR